MVHARDRDHQVQLILWAAWEARRGRWSAPGAADAVRQQGDGLEVQHCEIGTTTSTSEAGLRRDHAR